MKIKRILISILPPIIAGSIGSIFMLFSKIDYDKINKPSFAPPSIVFPIVWSILYVVIGVSTYIYLGSEKITDENKSCGIIILFIDMFFNALWTFFYFFLGQFFFACIWLGIMIVIASSRMIIYYKGNKVSGLLNLFYIIWLTIAFYLNISTILLN